MKLHTVKLHLKEKFRKKSKEEKLLEMQSQMDLLLDDLSTHIFQDTERLRCLREQHETDIRAEKRIKNAYSAMYVLTRAKDDLKNVDSDAELANVINKTGRILAKLNQHAEYSPQIGGRFFTWEAETVDERINGAGGAELKIPYDEKVNVSDTIVDRLMNGKSVNQCIQQDMNHSAIVSLDNASEDPSVTLDAMPASSGNSVQEDYEEILRKIQQQDLI